MPSKGNARTLRRQHAQASVQQELIGQWWDAQKKAEKGDSSAAEAAAEYLSEVMLLLRAGKLAGSPLKSVVHKNSVLFHMAELCESHSYTSPEIPIWTMLNATGYFLAKRGVMMQTPGFKPCAPQLWTLVFADSGARKSQLSELALLALGLDLHTDCIGKVDSSAALRDRFIALNGKPTMMYDDEFGQTVEKTHGTGPLANLSQVMICAYDGVVTREKAGGDSERKAVCAGFLGFDQTKLVHERYRAADWLSGLLPRMSLVVAPTLSNEGHSFYEVGRRNDPSALAVAIEESGVLDRWAYHLKSVKLHPVYTETKTATELLRERMGRWIKTIGCEGPFVTRGQFACRKIASGMSRLMALAVFKLISE